MGTNDLTTAYCIYHAKLWADLFQLYTKTWRIRADTIVDCVFDKNYLYEMLMLSARKKCQTTTKEIMEEESLTIG